jgi:hypothetical protein
MLCNQLEWLFVSLGIQCQLSSSLQSFDHRPPHGQGSLFFDVTPGESCVARKGEKVLMSSYEKTVRGKLNLKGGIKLK